MFERFTDKARHAVVLAQDEARRLDHSYIGTEHVLLGLLGEPEAIAGRVLSQLGIGLATTRTDVERIVGRGDGAPSGHIPFTPRAKKVLELSLREALGMGHNYIGTEHILLGVVREGEGVAMAVLEERGATPANIRSLVQAALERVIGAKGTKDAPPEGRRTAGADAVITAAQQLAGAGPMGSHHLLEAMALVDDSLASGALVALGVDADALAAKIDELGTEGTTDLSPEETGAQQMELRVGDDEVTIVLRDATMLELGRMLTGAIGNPVAGTAGTASPLVGLWLANLVALRELVERVDPDRGGRPRQPRRHRAGRHPQPSPPPRRLSRRSVSPQQVVDDLCGDTDRPVGRVAQLQDEQVPMTSRRWAAGRNPVPATARIRAPSRLRSIWVDTVKSSTLPHVVQMRWWWWPIRSSASS